MGFRLRSYQRVHKFEHPVEAEETKIGKEVGRYIARSRKQERVLRKFMRDTSNEELLDELEQSSLEAYKELRNARTHKKRLKELLREGLE